MADKDFSDVTWKEFFDARRDTAFSSRADEKMATADGKVFKHVGEEDGEDLYQYFDDWFRVPVNSPRDVVFKYALYREKVLDDGGAPSEFAVPTKKGWK